MIILIDIIMKGMFFIMMVSVLFYFGYAIGISKCSPFELNGIWSNQRLREVAGRCFEERHANQFIIVVKTFKYSFFCLIALMVLRGVLSKFT